MKWDFSQRVVLHIWIGIVTREYTVSMGYNYKAKWTYEARKKNANVSFFNFSSYWSSSAA